MTDNTTTSDAAPPAYLRPEDLADRWATKPKTLANWRTAGKGPAFVKIGASVRYALADVLAFEAENRVTAVAG